MSTPRCVTHLIDSEDPAGAEVLRALPGLFEFQRGKGWRVEVVTRGTVDQAESAITAADVVHVHGVSDWITRQGRTLVRNKRGRYLVSTYAMTTPRPFRRQPVRWPWGRGAARRRLLRKAWCLHALSESEAEYLKRRHHRPVKILPLGIDAPADGDPANDPGDRPDDERPVLFLGTLHPSEGLVPFLKAASLLADDFADLQLILAGTPHTRWTPTIQAAIRRQGFDERVRVVASPDADTLQGLLRQALLVVVPVGGDCCPVAALLALSRGVPVLISPGCHLPDVGLRKAGWIVRPKRVELHRALRDIFGQRVSDLEDAGRRGRELIRERYCWERLGPEYLNLYQRMLQ